MTMPPLPAAGDTNWRNDWAQAVHDAATEVTDGRLTEEAQRAAFGLVVKVTQHGALGDGSTDDTAAVQAAATAATDGTLYFPKAAAYYRLATVTIPSNTRVVFAPGAGVQPLTGNPVLTATGATDVTVEGGKHHGGAYDLGGEGLFSFFNCERVAVIGGTFSDIANNCAAILFEGTKHSTAHRNHIIGGGYGVIVGALSANGSPTSDYNVVSENFITDTVMDSIFVTSSLASTATTNVCRGNKVINNTVIGCGDAGIESGIGCRDTLIAGNTVHGSSGPNILIRDNKSARVAGNHSYDSDGATGSYRGGIAVLDQTAPSSTISITDNHCEGNAYAGINITASAASKLLISGNTCVNNTGLGIWIDATQTGAITGNLCSGNAGAGIAIYASGSNPGNFTVTGNTCLNNVGAGIDTTGEDMTITGNRCFDDQGVKTQTYGIHAHTGQGNFALILGNNCRGNGDATADILVDGGALSATVAYNKGRYTPSGSA